MPKPETIVVSTGAVLLLSAITLFAVGSVGEHPELRRIGVWVFIAAVSVAFLPLLCLLVVLCWEKLFRQK